MRFVYTLQDLVAIGMLILFIGGLLLLILISLVVDFVSKIWNKRWWK